MKRLSLLFLFLLVGCSGLAQKETYTLRLIGDFAFEPKTTFEEIPFGGISGITYDKKTKRLIGISDDRSQRGPARFYEFDLQISESVFDIKINTQVILRAANQSPFKKGEVDFEGIAQTPSGDLIISSEGDNRMTPRIPPSLMMFSKEGFYKGWIAVPDRYLPEHKGETTKGPRNNMAFESLGITKEGKYLFTGTEDTMVQDGELTSLSKPGVIRIARFKRKDAGFVFNDEFAYPLEKIPAIEGHSETRGVNGLVEIVPMSKNHFFTMERAWTPENRKQTIKIFKVTIESDSTDVSSISSLKGSKYRPVKKVLIADLDDYIPLLTAGKKKLDNIEGLALGPKLKNGNHTLIVISDDNFNKRQRTMLMAFEIL
ncbi:MAG: hypothetical protein CME70_09525 [Halobacteriovorax sp.]|nr:hypothetical protein [Halobacteriovorax sp.]|tara:strand:+ start:162428 stop:163543 length:1116 start_codon:yes stop_codon:yes gene_type:complete